ncbi:hypothetical protein FOA52_008698 [Chlamydomonas sp. UWO 241]|nr:hypothetical protein FOA52_008698 [Chlamydomonas sp. UWO 241]
MLFEPAAGDGCLTEESVVAALDNDVLGGGSKTQEGGYTAEECAKVAAENGATVFGISDPKSGENTCYYFTANLAFISNLIGEEAGDLESACDASVHDCMCLFTDGYEPPRTGATAACTTQLSLNGVASGTCADDIDGGGWVLVRHLPIDSTYWHETNDDLQGTWSAYGSPSANISAARWGVEWNTNFDQFLFATGSCKHWLIATPAAVGTSYMNGTTLVQPITYVPNDGARSIVKSSASLDGLDSALWYKRSSAEDPWISVEDHGDQPGSETPLVVYGENSFSNNVNKDLDLLPLGANVYIRNTECATCSP